MPLIIIADILYLALQAFHGRNNFVENHFRVKSYSMKIAFKIFTKICLLMLRY